MSQSDSKKNQNQSSDEKKNVERKSDELESDEKKSKLVSFVALNSAKQRLEVNLNKMRIHAKKALGQNFLVSDLVIKRILDQVQKMNFDQLIEVGPGPGALTDYLVQLQKPYLVLELDDKICEFWESQGLEVVRGDALRIDWRPLYRHSRVLLVSNLPYQISSSLVIDRSLEKSGLSAMVLMFQKEVAQRIRAEARGEHYGLLSVIAQAFWTISMVCEAGPGDFSPAPKVASRVLVFVRQEVSDHFDRAEFLRFVKASFQQRRKLLRKNLNQYLQQKGRDESHLEAWLKSKSHSPMARAEELSVRDFLELYEVLN